MVETEQKQAGIDENSGKPIFMEVIVHHNPNPDSNPDSNPNPNPHGGGGLQIKGLRFEC